MPQTNLEKNMKHISEIKVEKSTNKFLNAMFKETSKGETANGAVTYIRSGSFLLDFYSQAGAMRKDPQGALDLFKKSYAEDKLNALKVLFYLRDVRGGQGERDLFRTSLQWLGDNDTEVFEKILPFVAEYGRFDDLFFDNEKVFELLKAQIKEDTGSETPSLLAKWLPTANASSPTTRAKAKFMADKLGMNDIEYRKTVRSIRKQLKVVEEKMSANNWKEINYSHVPSQASRIYKNAFKKHDETRYGEFIGKAEKGEVKINAATLYPYQIYKSVQSDYSQTLEALWNQLPDYTQGKNALVVADVSGSMSGDPMSVSVSLALYFAERNKGQFQNHFITFSQKPTLQRIIGNNLKEKIKNLESAHWDMSTNLQAVFDLVLRTAVFNNTPVEEIPSTLYIISDMEFDSVCDRHTNLEVIRSKYNQSGYTAPNLVFWNVNASGRNVPAQFNEQGVAMVSGFSPVIFKMAVENKTPEQVMFDTINSERYAKIKIH